MYTFKLKYLLLLSYYFCEASQIKEIEDTLHEEISNLNRKQNIKHEFLINIKGTGSDLSIINNSNNELVGAMNTQTFPLSNSFMILDQGDSKSTTGKISFTPGEEIYYEDAEYILQTKDKKEIVGKKKGMLSMFKKTFPISYLKGIEMLMHLPISLEKSNIQYKIIPFNKNSCVVLFTNKNINLNKKNSDFTLIKMQMIDNRWGVTHMIICIEGRWSLIKLNSPLYSL